MASAAQVEKRAAGPKAGGTKQEDDVVEPRTIPLDLAPLVTPYKKHGRLSLRVERMPQQARLSKGTRNSDGSWSLTRDDLEDLEFSIPADAAATHKLAVRIISLVGGNTLAVIEVPVVPVEVEAKAPAPAATSGAIAGDDVPSRRLMDELGALKIILATRESELAELKLLAAQAAPESSGSDVEGKVAAAREAGQRETQVALARAEETWKTAEAARFAAAEAKWRAEIEKAATAAGQDPVLTRELKGLRDQLATAQATLAERDAALASAEVALKRASAWNDGEAGRLAEAEATWRSKAAKDVAAARAESDARSGEHGTALRQAREKIAALESELEKREAALGKAREGEAARLAEAEAAWRSRTSKEVAAARAESDTRTGEHSAALREARDTVASLKAAVDEREAALNEARAAVEQARAGALRDTQDALAKAERSWKEAEAARFRAAEAEWRAQTEKVASSGGEQDAALKALREQLTSLQGTLRQRERALASADKTFEQAREQWQREMHEAVAKADKEFKAKEAARRSAAEAQLRKEMAGSLAHATARYEAAETALAQIRMNSPGNGARAEAEMTALRASLEAREAELVQARTTIESLRGEGPAATPAVPDNRRYVRDALVAGGVGFVAMALYFAVGPRVSLPTAAPAKQVEAAVPAAVAAPQVPMASVTRDAKLRAQPDKAATVITIVAKGREVFVLEKRDVWVRVQVEGGKPVEGWIRDTALKEASPAPAAP